MLMLNKSNTEPRKCVRRQPSLEVEQLLSKTRITPRRQRKRVKLPTTSTGFIATTPLVIKSATPIDTDTNNVVYMDSCSDSNAEEEEENTDDEIDDQLSPPARYCLLSPVSSFTDDDEDGNVSTGKNYSLYSSSKIELALQAAITASIIGHPPLASSITESSENIDNPLNKSSTSSTNSRLTSRFVISRRGKVYKSPDLLPLTRKPIKETNVMVSDVGSYENTELATSRSLNQFDNPLTAPSVISSSHELSLLHLKSGRSLQQQRILELAIASTTPLAIVNHPSTDTLCLTKKPSLTGSDTVFQHNTSNTSQKPETNQTHSLCTNKSLAPTKTPLELSTFSVTQTPLYERRPPIPLALYYVYEDPRWLLMTALQMRLRRKGLLKDTVVNDGTELNWDEPALIVKSASEVGRSRWAGRKFVRYKPHIVEEWDEYGIQRRMVPARWVAKRAEYQ